MTAADVTTIEASSRQKGAKPITVIDAVQKARAKKGQPALSESAIRRVLRGEAYQRAKAERRGRPRKSTRFVIKAFEKSRKKLSKKAKNTMVRVTYRTIMHDAKLTGKVSKRRLQPALKAAEDVRFRPDRKRPDRSRLETVLPVTSRNCSVSE